MSENQACIRLLRVIRNMMIGMDIMVFALGLLAFEYVFTQGSSIFVVIFFGSALLFFLGAIWWWGSRRPLDPVNDPQERP